MTLFEPIRSIFNQSPNRYTWVFLASRDGKDIEDYLEETIEFSHACSAVAKLISAMYHQDYSVHELKRQI